MKARHKFLQGLLEAFIMHESMKSTMAILNFSKIGIHGLKEILTAAIFARIHEFGNPSSNVLTLACS
ncbi:hypothetical protein I3760_02G072800 [Carya illinoinensis]|uniref:Uncharacterized protein n=1 Tax=Carya illinoinensis TaxID=32201 RepID=A0A8T1RAT7_CARIL|nr:hypothetical protein I3760_02G072800 [Carya illinoinensis]KAG6664148.1 hypothetical protein CIPAW_02G072400 [Carya illinoinensis]